MFRDSVKSTGYPLHSPVSLSLLPRVSPCAITFELDSEVRLSYIALSRFWILPHSPRLRYLSPSLESPRRFLDITGLRVARLLGTTIFIQCFDV